MALPTHTSLQNRLYFPSFAELPQADELDNNYFTEQPNGMLLPNRTWTFFGEIVADSLSQLSVLGHRVEVRDVTGSVHSILFFPTSGSLDMGALRTGATVFVRYAMRCFFSDLATEAIKVEELNFVKVIPMNLDTLLYTAAMYFDRQSHCAACGACVAGLGGGAPRCESCQAAVYCSGACREANAPLHGSFCALCCELAQVFNLSFDSFIEWVPFRQ
ncbi:hypothetical protein HYH02_001295 [Chlamydomonas schloesseri]|uniref:MYND-type domain-containing protein n=1 Tax=Chlamydomonas schloesseri TaxID=2026947 RepID=A0A835WW47_9CHLO|nr:hypothetical protein HYH02_001295 [Chlamydomonas schloesseri]|eukprot:KAG2454263.1 hypothetical protein HYH02_001295 [Chlamydomonas schloesseri]